MRGPHTFTVSADRQPGRSRPPIAYSDITQPLTPLVWLRLPGRVLCLTRRSPVVSRSITINSTFWGDSLLARRLWLTPSGSLLPEPTCGCRRRPCFRYHSATFQRRPLETSSTRVAARPP